jgi:hypothetical protein
MCWNPDISLNTFIFSCFVLLFIYYTNTYTKYKTHTFDNPLVYLYIFSVASMQLIEHFLWKNLNNKKWNIFLSKFSSVILNVQVLFLFLLVNPTFYRNLFFVAYAIFLIVYFYYKDHYNPIHFYTTISSTNHLSWEWMKYNGFENIFFVIFLLFYTLPLFFINNLILSLCIIGSLVISLLFYFKNNTFGSMWCWITNIFLLCFVIDILLIQPFKEYNALC